MFSEHDKEQIKQRGSCLNTIVSQIENFKNGFPFLCLEQAATEGNGIIRLDAKAVQKSIEKYEHYIGAGIKPLKFVPASGAASRMFKALFEALEQCASGKNTENTIPENKEVRQFLENIEQFAFYNDLKAAIEKSHEEPTHKNLIDFLLNEKGIGYGTLPKGLLKFHKYGAGTRTPFEEHLCEGALYAKSSNKTASIHFTISPEHRSNFENLLKTVKNEYEKELNVTFEITFSTQHPSTDTIAVCLNNEPFRGKDGSLLFRPAGHGALIENLNNLDADIIFIKNIDNVVPDRIKKPTIEYKKALAGILLDFREKIFAYQKELNEKHQAALNHAFLAEVANFLENKLNVKPAQSQYYTEKEELYRYLKEKYNRPLRICGMVKNEREPGGGPFWAKNHDGTVSLQIVESSQIDLKNTEQQAVISHTTHFNPVDLVCSIKNYKGEKYNLTEFTDPTTGFISKKSKDGKELKAQELPGLWNGAMSNWITIFVEVPPETFNPVKTVNDLLRDRHR